MALYEFQTDDGDLVEEEHPMTRPPCAIGARIRLRDGRMGTRLVPQLGALRVQPTLHLQSESLPERWEAHRRAGGSFDGEGRCRFDSWAQLERTMGVAREMGEPIRYLGYREYEGGGFPKAKPGRRR